MQFLRIKPLVKQLSAGPISGKELRKYWIAWSAFCLLGLAGMLQNETWDNVPPIECWVDVLLIGCTITACYHMRDRNRPGFIAELICIAWPETCKFLVVFGAVLVALPPRLASPQLDALLNAFALAGLLAVCLRVVWFMRQVDRGRRNQKQFAEAEHRG